MAEAEEADKTNNAAPTNWADTIRDAVKNSAEVDDDLKTDEHEEEDVVEDVDKAAEAGEDVIVDDKGGDEGGEADDNAEEDKDKSKPFRFTQFKGDGKPETYLKNLEDSYASSYQEIKRVQDEAQEASTKATALESQLEAIKTAVSADPEFGKRVIELLDQASETAKKNGGTATAPAESDNPFVRDSETKWKQANDESAAEFAKDNPEVLDDPILAEKVKKLVKQFGTSIYADEHRLPLSGELMAKAYGYLGLTVKKQEKQELADAMKKGAAPTRKQAPKKKPSGSKQFSDLTMSIAGKMGISKERLEKNGVSR